MLLSAISTEKLFDFFHNRVMSVSNKVGTPHLADDTRLYLTKLLLDAVRQDQQPFPDITTLTELYAEAINAPAQVTRARTYQVLGDRALLTVGWFPESLERKIVSHSYYIGMGASAYSRTNQWFGPTFGPIFRQLSSEFEECVRVLDSARPRSDLEMMLMLAPTAEV